LSGCSFGLNFRTELLPGSLKDLGLQKLADRRTGPARRSINSEKFFDETSRVAVAKNCLKPFPGWQLRSLWSS
jgi:hypothetical protein